MQDLGIISQLFGFAEIFRGFGYHISVQISAIGRVKYAQVDVFIPDLVVNQVEVFADGWGGRAVIAGQEFVYGFVNITVRVPEQFGQDIGAQFGEFAAAAG